MYLVRTRGEVDYIDGLDAITNAVIDGLRGQGIVANEATVWQREQLFAQFHFVGKIGVY